MQKFHNLTLMVAFLSLVSAFSEACAEDFSLQFEEVFDVPEADQVVRHGDVDNLGFGWPTGFDPFSGMATPAHAYPWPLNPADAAGTDRIMVVSSYNGNPPQGRDGYSSTTTRPDNTPRMIPMSFTPPPMEVHAAVLQIFVDDFQAPVWGSRFQVIMNGIRVQELEDILNVLNQTGPIGKLISFQLPDRVLANMMDGRLNIFVDDPVTGAGDGFAFDFFRLLINPRELPHTGIVKGQVHDLDTGEPLAGVTISTAGAAEVKTDENGYFLIDHVIAGLAALQASLAGYESQTKTVEVIENQETSVSFFLKPSAIEPCLCPDTDQDGVPDAWDRCPETPLGSYVDRYGCPQPARPANPCDINNDGKTGLPEAIHALEVTAGVVRPE